MTRSLKYDIPGPDRRVSLAELEEKGLPALFEDELAPAPRLVVELGFGRGEFLRHLAAEAPEVAHLGVERSFKRVLKMARRLARGEERNIRLLEAKAEDVVEQGLADGTVETFWINFPDPWPKKRHHGRRMIQAPFVALLARRLVPGGRLQVATDHVEYAEAIDQVLGAEPELENELPAPFVREVPGRLHTAYESEWRREGRPLHFFTYRRREDDRSGAA